MHFLDELGISVYKVIVVTVHVAIFFMRCARMILSEKIFELSHEFILNRKNKEFNELYRVVLVVFKAFNDLNSLVTPFLE
jgi:hypothetical protein